MSEKHKLNVPVTSREIGFPDEEPLVPESARELREKEASLLAQAMVKPPITEAKVVGWIYDEATSQLSRWMQEGWSLHSWQLGCNANGANTFNAVLVK